MPSSSWATGRTRSLADSPGPADPRLHTSALLWQREDQTWACFSCPTSARSAPRRQLPARRLRGTPPFSEHRDKMLPELPTGVQEPEVSPPTGTDCAWPSDAVWMADACRLLSGCHGCRNQPCGWARRPAASCRLGRGTGSGILLRTPSSCHGVGAGQQPSEGSGLEETPKKRLRQN